MKPLPDRLRRKSAFAIFTSLISLFLIYHSSFGQETLFFRMRVLKYKEPQPAKNFEVLSLKGNPFQLRQFRKRLVLLNFWATWCGPCKREMVPMETLYQRFREAGLVILAVSLDQGGAKVVQSFVDKKGLTFPIGIDPTGKAKSLYHVTSLPTTFLIDRDGRIVGKCVGPRDWASEEAFALVESLLGGNH